MTEKKEYEYVSFELTERKSKTGVWDCKNIKHNESLGYIKWHPAWRQYCYFPTVQAVYSKGCLEDISDFIKLVDKERLTLKTGSVGISTTDQG